MTTRPPVKALTSLTTYQSHNLIVELAHPEAIIPKQASTKVAGYDPYSVQTSTVKSNCILRINIGLKLQLPMNTYGYIASHNGLVVKYSVHTEGGVIDPDFTGELQVILHNFGTSDFTVYKCDRIAQLILEQFESPIIVTAEAIEQTL